MNPIQAKNIGELYKTNLQVRSHQFNADEPQDIGGTDLAPSPMEYLKGALASCTAITIRMYANRKQWPLDEVIVTVDDVPHIETQSITLKKEVTLIGNLSQEQLDRLQDIGHKCPIEKILKNSVEII